MYFSSIQKFTSHILQCLKKVTLSGLIIMYDDLYRLTIETHNSIHIFAKNAKQTQVTRNRAQMVEVGLVPKDLVEKLRVHLRCLSATNFVGLVVARNQQNDFSFTTLNCVLTEVMRSTIKPIRSTLTAFLGIYRTSVPIVFLKGKLCFISHWYILVPRAQRFSQLAASSYEFSRAKEQPASQSVSTSCNKKLARPTSAPQAWKGAAG